jgi:hypothetical protein
MRGILGVFCIILGAWLLSGSLAITGSSSDETLARLGAGLLLCFIGLLFLVGALFGKSSSQNTSTITFGVSNNSPIYTADDGSYSTDEPESVYHARLTGEALRAAQEADRIAERELAFDRMGHLQPIPGVHPAHPPQGHTPIMGDVEIEDARFQRIDNDGTDIEL